VSTLDHNKTLVIIHAAIGTFFTLGLIASPWIIAQNFNRPDKMLFAAFVFGVVFLFAGRMNHPA
jgi:ABC-type Mn2+/Zn2+ transport system permease subunit